MKPKHLIYATCFVTLLYIAPSVCISSMVASFGQARQAAVLSLLTLPSLTSIAGLFLAPVLAKRASLRALNLAALALLTATGLASFACAGSLEVLLALSAVMGVAYGLLNTLFPLLAAAYYQGDELGRVMGVASGMLQLGRVAAMLAGGALAGLGWRYVYLLFLMALAPLAMSFALRRPAPQAAASPQARAGACTGAGCWAWVRRVFRSPRCTTSAAPTPRCISRATAWARRRPPARSARWPAG